MAGRGTDIKLGPGVKEPRTIGWIRSRGIDLQSLVPADPAQAESLEGKPDDYVVEVGGLHIIGSERHESRRIDRQLRGRAGRQGDPGASQFFLSLEDDLMRLFGSDRIAAIMTKLGAEEGEVITHPLITRSIERAQRRVEMQNFEARKRLLDYDDVMNQQREVIYDLRLFALEGGADLKGEILEMVEHAVRDTIGEYVDADEHPENWDLAGLRNRLVLDYFVVVEDLPAENTADHPFDTPKAVEELVLDRVREAFRRKLKTFGEHDERILSYVLLSVIDEKWRDHLYDLDHLKASIGFRGWGQKDPLIEYKQEAYNMFVDLMKDIRKSVASLVFRAQLAVRPAAPPPPRRLVLSGPSDTPVSRLGATEPLPAGQEEAERVPAGVGGRSVLAGMTPVDGPDVRRLQTNRGEGGGAAPRPVTVDERIGRNDPCPCGSGRKYKKCHGSGLV